MNYTHGGFPESEAWHWSPEKYQEFGGILFMLMSSKADNRRRGRNEFYEFKRHFMIWEFDEIIDELNDFRSRKGFPTIPELLESIEFQIVHKSGVKDSHDTIKDTSTFIDEKISKPMTLDELKNHLNYFEEGKAEQLSLFE
jgi:hypothetical protein